MLFMELILLFGSMTVIATNRALLFHPFPILLQVLLHPHLVVHNPIDPTESDSPLLSWLF